MNHDVTIADLDNQLMQAQAEVIRISKMRRELLEDRIWLIVESCTDDELLSIITKHYND